MADDLPVHLPPDLQPINRLKQAGPAFPGSGEEQYHRDELPVPSPSWGGLGWGARRSHAQRQRRHPRPEPAHIDIGVNTTAGQAAELAQSMT